jgi:ribonuclease E
VTLDHEPTGTDAGSEPAAATSTVPDQGVGASITDAPPKTPVRRRRAASRPAGPPQVEAAAEPVPAPAEGSAPAGTPPETSGVDAEPAPARPVRKRASRKKAVPPAEVVPAESAAAGTAAAVVTAAAGTDLAESSQDAPQVAPATTRRRRTRKTAAAEPVAAEPVAGESVAGESVAGESVEAAPGQGADAEVEPEAGAGSEADQRRVGGSAPVIVMPLFQAPDPAAAAPRRRRAASRPAGPPRLAAEEDDESLTLPVSADAEEELADDLVDAEDDEAGEESGEGGRRRRRRRGGRGRRGRARGEGEAEDGEPADETAEIDADDDADDDSEDVDGDIDEDGDQAAAGSRRRRRRRRRGGSGDTEPSPDDPPNTVVKVRESRRPASDDVAGVKGSTRLEAKKQRRREGREAGRRRTVITEAEFLARRESVERVMVVRERDGRTQIGVLEDGVLVEHYVARRTQNSMVGNVYLGRVQNVLPSMEAAFVDIGKGRNAVLYAGEVNWDAAGLEGQPKRIEHALKSGESVLVQVTKDPIGHKGARLTSQASLPGRYLVYVPDGSMTGISRKLPEPERARLKKVLRQVVPDDAGVIVRTAAEGASEAELERDVSRLRAQWEDISRKAGAVKAPALLYGEPDLAIRVVRDIFNEDFSKLVISGDDAWDTLQAYIGHVAPDLVDRLERWAGEGDVFAAQRIDEQLAKALERKVWLPSGGSLVIDRTEAMTVIDVNTGKFTGAGGNLEETVTKNNLEAAEEIVRQLRLRDLGGIIVVDFIDMVLESNRDLVLRRLLECLGRDRTKHQVAEVTSLGLVQMTRKRVGSGLLEVFSETCEHCGGRGLIIHDQPVEKRPPNDANRSRGGSSSGSGSPTPPPTPSGTGSPGPGVPAPGAADASAGAGSGDEPTGRHRRRRGGRGGSADAGSGDVPTLAAGS